MDKERFAAWMDEQMEDFRKNGIPFFGYLWYNWKTGAQGAALLRLDKPEGSFSKKITKASITEMKRSLRRLERDFHNHVTIYQG